MRLIAETKPRRRCWSVAADPYDSGVQVNLPSSPCTSKWLQHSSSTLSTIGYYDTL